MSCKHCESRLEEMAKLVSDFWYAYDHFSHVIGFDESKEKFIDRLDLEDYCWGCKSWFPARLRNTLDFERRKHEGL